MLLRKKNLLAVTVGLLLLGGNGAWLLYSLHVHSGGERSLKSNVQTVEFAVEDFSEMAGGCYPISINTTVEEAIGVSSSASEGLFSIAGARGLDPVSEKDIGSTGPKLLPKAFRNPYYRSQPALATSFLDPPEWSPEVRGMVFYVPLDIEGKTAGGYKIYGAGPDSLLGLVLTPEE